MEFEDFQRDDKTIDAVIRNLIIIGEAARHIPDEISSKYPNIPWRIMGDMRNFAVHEYWGVEMRTIWKTIREDLPPLLPELNQVVDSETTHCEYRCRGECGQRSPGMVKSPEHHSC